jgi:hypothetical protein
MVSDVEQLGTAEAALNHRHGRHVLLQARPQANAGAADEHHGALRMRRVRVFPLEGLQLRLPHERVVAPGLADLPMDAVAPSAREDEQHGYGCQDDLLHVVVS